MKTRKFQRLVAIILMLSMCFPFSAFAVEPTGVGSTEELALDSCCLEDIRTNFEANIFEDESFDPLNYYSAAQTGTDVLNIFDSLSSTLLVMYDSGNLNAVEYETVAQNLQNARNDKLDELDEVYYILTLDNIDEVESELQTDFSSIGIDFSGDAADSSFLILIDGDDANNDISPQSSIGSTTTYTYNGTTYYLRMITFTSSDYPSYAQSTTTDLLTSKTESFVKKILGSLFQAALSSVSEVIGYISDLLGITVSSFGAQGSGASVNAALGASWRRVYRQVWNSSTSTWVYGSCVECAVCSWALSSVLYNSTSAKYESSSGDGSFTKYSTYYYDTDWQREYAVLGYINGRIYYDKTGSVNYNFGTTRTVTLSEPAA